MQANEFKRAASQVANPKEVKAHLRLLPRKTSTALFVKSAIALSVAVSRLEIGLAKYVVGYQLNDELKDQARSNLGAVYQHLFALAKAMKVKVPASGKKIKLHGQTTTEGLLTLHELSSNLMQVVQNLTDGVGLDEKLELGEQVVETIVARVTAMLNELYAFTYTLLGVVPADILADHFALMQKVYGEELFLPKVKAAEEAPAAE